MIDGVTLPDVVGPGYSVWFTLVVWGVEYVTIGFTLWVVFKLSSRR